MKDYKEYFKNKKVTVMGLGLLGRGVGDAKFLAECGAKVLVTDLKTKKQLASSLAKLKKSKNIKYVLGKHKLEDFRNRDFILKAAGVPLDSPYIKEAKKHNIPIEMDVSLFAKIADGVMVIGITGTRGKSMTTALIYEILKQNEKFLKRKIYIGGNVRGVATLPLLKSARKGDIVVCELDSWQMHGFGEANMSPHIGVFTSFMLDHMNYYGNNMKTYFNDKENIFKYQKKGDILVVRPGVKKLIPKNLKSKLIVADRNKVKNYSFTVPGEFQQENLACAVEVAKIFKIPISNMKKAVKNFKGVEGRLQYLKTVKGMKIYNDNSATTPEATMAGMEALSIGSRNIKSKNKIVLICGGADKKLDLRDFRNAINTYSKAVVFIPGTGTKIFLQEYKFKVPSEVGRNLQDVIKKAMRYTKKGDILLFSPAFASFGMFTNEYDRGDQFIKIVKGLK